MDLDLIFKSAGYLKTNLVQEQTQNAKVSCIVSTLHISRVTNLRFILNFFLFTLRFLASVSTQLKADLRLPRGLGEKLLLRCLAARRTVGLNRTALEPKRAIQFGSRIAKLEVAKEKGGDKAVRF